MLHLQEHVPLAPKTTMKIGGTARYFAELKNKNDVEEAAAFAKKQQIPLIVLGGGSNTIFADDEINALIIKIIADTIDFDNAKPFVMVKPREPSNGEQQRVTVQSGAFLASLINECAKHNFDLSPLTGIPGTVGGAIFGNAGQGFGGIWMDSFIESVEVFQDGVWKTMQREECEFGYRKSIFKKYCHGEVARTMTSKESSLARPRHDMHTSIIFSATLSIPTRPQQEIEKEISRLLQRRIETQPHKKTAGSCFLSLDTETPAWKLIDAAGFRGYRVGGLQVSEKHANFLMNEGEATFEDAKNLVEHIRQMIPQKLSVEMRFINADGSLAYANTA